MLGVRTDEFLDGRPLVESVDRVLEELYDDRWSTEAAVAGASEGLGVKGASVADVASDGELVSSMSGAPLPSFFDDWFPRRKNAFQLGVLGVLGPGDDGLWEGVCSVRPT